METIAHHEDLIIPLQGQGSQEKERDLESILEELRIGELSEEEAEKVRRILAA
jgi:hypothetical protein